MKRSNQLAAVAIGFGLAIGTLFGANADTVERNHPLDGQNQVYLRLNSFLQANIIDTSQGTVCHGINVTSYNPYKAQGSTIDTIANDTGRTVYFFTGPTCDGFAHVAYSGQLVGVSNSTNTSDMVLVKSYYFR